MKPNFCKVWGEGDKQVLAYIDDDPVRSEPVIVLAFWATREGVGVVRATMRYSWSTDIFKALEDLTEEKARAVVSAADKTIMETDR